MFGVAGPGGSDEDRAEWALRPEPTAGIVRAFIEHGLHVRPGPLRLWHDRADVPDDRPQAGRYRQFSQWDVEVIGDAGPAVDAELIELGPRGSTARSGLRDVVASSELHRRRDLPPGTARRWSTTSASTATA